MFEDAKIGGTTPQKESKEITGPVFPDKIPSVLSTDDLVFEVGKQAVRALNIEKVVDRITAEMNRLRALLASSQQHLEKVPELESSNKSYQEKNRALDLALVDTRRELAGAKDLLKTKDIKIMELERVKDSAEKLAQENKKQMQHLELQVSSAKQEISALNKEQATMVAAKETVSDVLFETQNKLEGKEKQIETLKKRIAVLEGKIDKLGKKKSSNKSTKK